MVSIKSSEYHEDHKFNKTDVQIWVRFSRAHGRFLDLNTFPWVCLSRKEKGRKIMEYSKDLKIRVFRSRYATSWKIASAKMFSQQLQWSQFAEELPLSLWVGWQDCPMKTSTIFLGKKSLELSGGLLWFYLQYLFKLLPIWLCLILIK